MSNATPEPKNPTPLVMPPSGPPVAGPLFNNPPVRNEHDRLTGLLIQETEARRRTEEELVEMVNGLARVREVILTFDPNRGERLADKLRSMRELRWDS